MRVPLSAAVTLGLLFFLSVGLNEQVVEGCRCIQTSPQQQYCNSDTVIRANITGEVKRINGGTRYGIKIIKTFKQNDKKPVQFIHSFQDSCGVTLKNKEYLLGGSAKDGVMEVNLCSLVKDWNSLSSVPVSEWL